MTNNSLTLFGGGNQVSLKNAKAMSAALRGAAADSSPSSLPDGGVYISFSGKAGRYSIGEEKNDADASEAWLVNIFSFEAGWICWKGGNPAAKRMGSVYGAPVPTPDFSEHGPFNESRGEGWHKSTAFMLRSLSDGTQGYFSTNTKSALREFAKIQGEIARRLEEGLAPWPVVQLDKEQFTGQGQKNWKPKLVVAGWLGIKQVNAMAAMDDLEAIAEALPKLLKQAAAEEAKGIPDKTLDSGDDEAEVEAEDEVVEEDDGIEDAEVSDDEAEVEVEEDEVEEDEVEEEPAPAPRAAQRRPVAGLRRASIK